jgi:hypothetical protein
LLPAKISFVEKFEPESPVKQQLLRQFWHRAKIEIKTLPAGFVV